MSEVARISELLPKFLQTVLVNMNHIDNVILEMISVEITKDSEDIRKRLQFLDYFEWLGFQKKVDLLELILKNNHPDIFKKFPRFFTELNELTQKRNKIAHYSIHFERDSNEKNAKLVLHHRKIKKQERLSETEMHEIMQKVAKCTEDTGKIFTLIGKSKGLNF